MLPNIDLRIANMIKAVEQVILPALPDRERLARDQAMLVAGHLRMIGDQWKWALAYEQISLDDLAGLGRVLLSHVAPLLQEQLEEALAVADTCDRSSITALEQANIVLGRVVDRIILGEGDPNPLPQAVADAVLDYGRRHARRERIWFKGNRLDPDQADLPDIGAMMAKA